MNKWPGLSLERSPDYQSCFGCGKDNPYGLKLAFNWDGKSGRAEFVPRDVYQGWPGMVHGGIVACLLDEGMGYAASSEVGLCVTAKMQIELKKPALVGKRLIISSSVKRKSRRLVYTTATISLEDGTLVAQGTGTHFIVNTNQVNKES